MIGLAIRAATGDSLGPCGIILGPIIAVLALCGIWKFCCKCRVRDCRCIKRMLRVCGTDQFDDFEVMIMVHTAKFTSAARTSTFVRAKAGDFVVETDVSTEGLFHQIMNLEVEQGTPSVELELCDSRKKVLATLKLDVMKDILEEENGVRVVNKMEEKTFAMKQKQKQIVNPKITISFLTEKMGDEEKALLSGINASAETERMLAQHVQKIAATDAGGGPDKERKTVAELSEIQLLAKGCTGPLDRFGKMGAKHRVYVAIVGPPDKKRYALHIYKGEKDFLDGKDPDFDVDLLKVTSIAADPSRSDVFVVNHVDDRKTRQSLKLNRVDRSRDVWVEMMQLIVMKVHAERKERKAKN